MLLSIPCLAALSAGLALISAATSPAGKPHPATALKPLSERDRPVLQPRGYTENLQAVKNGLADARVSIGNAKLSNIIQGQPVYLVMSCYRPDYGVNFLLSQIPVDADADIEENNVLMYSEDIRRPAGHVWLKNIVNSCRKDIVAGYVQLFKLAQTTVASLETAVSGVDLEFCELINRPVNGMAAVGPNAPTVGQQRFARAFKVFGEREEAFLKLAVEEGEDRIWNKRGSFLDLEEIHLSYL
ncbi:MAG: hypothetical protein M1829_005729 [Trizodia sp. TS-e1964]|nr:MAG: hypothetical protein M1829_005729 [Trizodia sp. TS-e1964]